MAQQKKPSSLSTDTDRASNTRTRTSIKPMTQQRKPSTSITGTKTNIRDRSQSSQILAPGRSVLSKDAGINEDRKSLNRERKTIPRNLEQQSLPRDSNQSYKEEKMGSSRQPTLSRDRGTTTSLQAVEETSRNNSRASPGQSSGPRDTRKESFDNVEYVPRRESSPPRRYVTVVSDTPIEEDEIPIYFETKYQRRHFVRVVYGILGIMLAVDFGFVAIAYFVEPVNRFVKEHIYVYIIAFVVFMVVYLCLACISKLREKSPFNYIMLAILCLSMGYLMACMTAYHSIEGILFAVAGTFFIVICVTIFAMFCPCDMTGWGLYLCMAGMALMAIALVVFVVCLVGLCGKSAWIWNLVISSLFVLLFSIYLAYDTQLIMGGKRYSLRPNEYVNGALHLWIDIVYIFLCMLTVGRITTAGS